MQDRYIGDVGDFAKFAILRRLSGNAREQPIRISVVWFQFPNETHNNDGRHVGYLRLRQFAGLDDDLRSALGGLVENANRRISAIARAGILPSETMYFDAPVGFVGYKRALRIRDRRLWFDECCSFSKECDLVFFDPDNGIEVPSIPKGHPKSGKYIYWDELLSIWKHRKTLLVYHHLNRKAPAAEQVASLEKIFKMKLSNARTLPLVFRRGSARVFWLIHHSDTIGYELERRAVDLLYQGWSRHFRPLGWPSVL